MSLAKTSQATGRDCAVSPASGRHVPASVLRNPVGPPPPFRRDGDHRRPHAQLPVLMTRRPRLVIAEDHEMIAEGLRQILRPAFHTLGIAGTGDALMQLLQRTTPDCVLLDLSLPGRSGLDVLPELHRRYPNMPVLVVTMHADRAIASAALAAGALGFIPKDSSVEELKTAIQEVLAGRQYLSRRVRPHTQHLGLAAVHSGLSQLSPRQQDIVVLIAKGMTSAEIAQLLGVSASTVAFHRLNIRRRLGITSDSGLLRYSVLVAATLQNDGGALRGGPPHPHAALPIP